MARRSPISDAVHPCRRRDKLVTRALLYLAAAKVTAGAPDKTRFAAMAKRLATDTGSWVVDRALQLRRLWVPHGLSDQRFWRDLRVHSILEEPTR